jgi:hypothetical protein
VKHSWILVIAASLSLATAAAGQDSPDLLASDRETSAQLNRILASVRSKGLPTEPVMAKARQGVMLHSAPNRIVAAAEGVARRLEEARDALAPSPSAVDLAAGQDALSIPGVTKDMLRAIRAARPNRPVAVPIGVMAQLVATGVKPAHASEILARLIRAQATDPQLVALGTDVNGDVLRGGEAATSLELRLTHLTPALAHIAGGAAQDGRTTSAIGGASTPPPSRP